MHGIESRHPLEGEVGQPGLISFPPNSPETNISPPPINGRKSMDNWGETTLLIGPFITDRGPPCRDTNGCRMTFP